MVIMVFLPQPGQNVRCHLSQRSGMMGGKWPEQAQRQIHLSQPTGKGLLIAAVMKHWNQKQLRIHHGGETLQRGSESSRVQSPA